ncbi:DUF342 domain-containing protein [bacterium]|nr:DUF342 domain-containing protein [bacterium]
MTSIIIEGEELEIILKEASEKLGVSDISELKYEILEVKKKGLLKKKNILKVEISVLENEVIDADNSDDSTDVEERNPFADLEEDLPIDGTYEITVTYGEGIFLTVTPSEFGGREIQITEVMQELETQGIDNVILSEVDMAVELQTGVPEKIAEFDPNIFKDAVSSVKIKNHSLEAYATVKPPKFGQDVKHEMLMSSLELVEVRFGIIQEALNEIVEKKLYDSEVLVARGVFPENGEDAQIVFNFDEKEVKLSPKELEDGSVDFKQLDTIVNVSKGEVIATRIPPTPGKEGKSVKGDIIRPKPGKDKKLPQGKNTRQSDDDLHLYSDIDGQLINDGKRIKVVPICEIKGDVDYSTGNIEFIGSVIIRGSVLDDFKVTAEGDIFVKGSINKCYLDAGQDIICEKGIIGREGGFIKAKRNVKAKFAENATIVAGNSVLMKKAFMFSNVKAGKEIKVTDKKGAIVGGELLAGNLVEAGYIGSDKETHTTLKVGISPELIERKCYIDERIPFIEKNIPIIEKILVQLKAEKNKQGDKFPQNKDVLLKKSFLTYKQYTTELPLIKDEKGKIDQQIDSARGGEVRAHNVIYPGCEIHIRKGVRLVKEPIKAAILIYQEGSVKVGQYLGKSKSK